MSDFWHQQANPQAAQAAQQRPAQAAQPLSQTPNPQMVGTLPGWEQGALRDFQSQFAGRPVGDQTLLTAIGNLAGQGVDVSNVDWTKIPESLRMYLRGGGQITGKLSDYVTGAQQMQNQMNQSSVQDVLSQLYPGLAGTSPADQTGDISQAIQPLLTHIEQNQATRGQEYENLANQYLTNNAKYMPPGLADLLKNVIMPGEKEAGAQLSAATEQSALEQPVYANLLTQLKQLTAAQQYAGKQYAQQGAGGTGAGLSVQNGKVVGG